LNNMGKPLKYMTDRVTFRDEKGHLRTRELVFGARSKAEARSVEGARRLTEDLRRRRSDAPRSGYGEGRSRPRSRMNLGRITFERKRRPTFGSSVKETVSKVLDNDPTFKKNVDRMDEIMKQSSERRGPRPARRSPHRSRGGEGRALRRKDGRRSGQTLSGRFAKVNSRRH